VEQTVFFNHQILPLREAQLPAISRAGAYGDGCFETLKTIQGRMLGLDLHIERLRQGMDYLGISHPKETSEARFAHIIESLLTANNLMETDARVRIQVWRNGPLGYQTGTYDEPILLVSAYPMNTKLAPLSLGIVQTRRIPHQSLPAHLKLSNGINYIVAQREARIAGYDEAIMLDIHNRVSETSMANLLWIRDGILETPSIACDPLPGITRKLVLDALKDLYPISESEFSTDRLNEAEAVFTCNSLRELHPVRKVHDQDYDPDSDLVQTVLKAWTDYRNDHIV